MAKDTIVYFGIIQYEQNNAMCQHAAGIKALTSAVGYRSVIIGVSANVDCGQFKRINEGLYVVNDPQNVFDSIKQCLFARDVKNVLLDIGIERIKSLIVADFRYLPTNTLFSFCKKQNINFVVDIMDRFVSGEGFFNKIKKLDSDLRMKQLYPKIPRRIYICSAYNELIGKGKKVAVIPGVTWTNCLPKKNDTSKIHLVFLGQPGLRCEKEKIDWVIRAIYEEGLVEKFKVYLAGFAKLQFLEHNPEIKSFITANIEFLGRITHDECMSVLRSADFSLVIRPDTILSKYGFSTKIGEAFSCGTPILATDTSDNSVYIKNGVNGFLCDCTYESVAEMIKKVSKLTPKDLSELKNNVYLNNPFDYSNYIDEFTKVVI